MKYFYTATFVLCILISMMFTENFVITMHHKILAWDYLQAAILNRETFMTFLGWGIAIIFGIFVSFTLCFFLLLAAKLAKPKIEIHVHMDNMAAGHLFLIGFIAICCMVANPVIQIIVNSYILQGYANLLIWFMLPFAIATIAFASFLLIKAIAKIKLAFKL